MGQGMQRLDIASFPLNGLRLIEASAGTGKTWTIAALYLRQLLERQLPVDQLLVVTFTEAATQELRGRIRQRLHEAEAAVAGADADPALDFLLAPRRGDKAVQQQLRDAVTRMDEAAIFTIHGFCQRMLTVAAFESGNLFQAEFVTDEQELRLQAVRDFWRRQVAAATPAASAWVLAQWKGPEVLLDTLKPLLGAELPQLQPQPGENELTALQQQCEQHFAQLQAQWRAERHVISSLLCDSPLLSRDKSKGFAQARLDALFTWLDTVSELAQPPLPLPADFVLLTQGKLNDPALHKKTEAKKGTAAPQHPCFVLAEGLYRSAAAYDRLRRAQFLQQAALALRETVAQRKREERILFFDDLLGRLDAALAGAGGEALAQRIRQLYPVAMIDEFQDTDSMQYRIFRRVYLDAPDTALYLIGDPKQAIYGFRGGDIFTYMRARRDTDAANAHFTLDVNHRSHSALVAGVNALFSHNPAPFLYPGDIEFQPVRAAGRADAEVLLIDGQPQRPLRCWLVDDVPLAGRSGWISKEQGRAVVAASCAAEVARLLNLGREGRACIGARKVQARDIALLVRDRFDAAALRSELAARGIGSVYISRDSVFATQEAEELLRLLRAVLEPASAALLRAALATRLLGATAAEIHALGDDEAAWDAKLQTFQDYRREWLRNGFMHLFRRLLHGEGIAARLRGLPDGERRLTNLLQLAELAQQASLARPGPEPLLRWLADAVATPDGNNEAQQLRLESDENLVQIVTIHKSKGLQYEIVFLPFPWVSRSSRREPDVLLFNDETVAGQPRCADLGSEQRDAARAQAEKQQLAEDLRLLYVALTRARQFCCFSWGRFSGAEASALAWLLHPPPQPDLAAPRSLLAALDYPALEAALQQHPAVQQELMQLLPLPAAETVLPAQSGTATVLRALPFAADTRVRLQLTSFSSLVQGTAAAWQVELPDHDQSLALQDSTLAEEPGVVLQPALADNLAVPSGRDIRFAFPRGARSGQLMHSIFERIDFARADAASLQPLVAAALEQQGLSLQWQDGLVRWISELLDTPLDADQGFCLRQLPAQRRLVELGFHFPLQQLQARALNALLRRSRGPGRAAPALDFVQLSGMMKGFIDLVFEHEGRFFVLDYKSNYLGERWQDYAAAALPAALDTHHYDLQYLIYLVALQRYLKLRLRDYDYERHIGGVYYLFLRGMHPQQGNACGVFAARPEQALIDELDRLFGGAAHD
jgi:exodeoxyribonuclease V beta subunit